MLQTCLLGFTHRQVSSGERNGKKVRFVKGQRQFARLDERIWQALTVKEHIAEWFLPISGELSAGGRFQLQGNARGEVLQCEAKRHFEVSWEFADNVSWLSVTIEPQSVGGQLTVEHILPTDAKSEAHWAQYGPGATGVGWDLTILGLIIYLDVNLDIIGDMGVEQWMSSDDGKAFITYSAQKWCEAHIEHGAPADVAQKMARHTSDFYCGEDV